MAFIGLYKLDNLLNFFVSFAEASFILELMLDTW